MGRKPGTGIRLVRVGWEKGSPIDHEDCKDLLKVSRCPVDSLSRD